MSEQQGLAGADGGASAVAADGATNTSGAETITVADHKRVVERAVKERLAKLGAENSDLKARIAEFDLIKGKLDAYEADKLTETQRLERKLERTKADAEASRMDLDAKLEAEVRAHHATRVAHAVMSAIVAHGGFVDAAIAAEVIATKLTVNGTGAVVGVDPATGDETPIADYVAAWAKAHPGMVRAPAPGSGDRGGQPASGRKAIGGMTVDELKRATDEAMARR
jgi:hypothetical protein